MNQNDLYYIPGSWNVICDSCGKKIKASEAKQRWDGLIVCPADFEIRQPQDFVKARADKITVPFTRPRPTDVFLNVCNLLTQSPTTDVGTTDCATLVDTGILCLADYAEADISSVGTITANLTFYQQYMNDFTTNYAGWVKEWCSPETRTAIAGLGQAGCCTTAYNIDAYL